MKTTPSEGKRGRGRPAHDLRGKRFDKLAVKEPAGRNGSGTRLWRCVCSCGNERLCTAGELNCGRTTSCARCGHRRASRDRCRDYWDKHETGPVSAMRAAGKTYREIASVMGVSVQSVYARLKKERALVERSAAPVGGGAA
jgi:hypothetical protein